MTDVHRGRGRPAVGPRVHFTCPAELLASIDQIATDAAMTRSEVIRELLAAAVKSPGAAAGQSAR